MTKYKRSQFSEETKKITKGTVYLRLAGRVFRVVTNETDTYITLVKKLKAPPKKKTSVVRVNYYAYGNYGRTNYRKVYSKPKYDYKYAKDYLNNWAHNYAKKYVAYVYTKNSRYNRYTYTPRYVPKTYRYTYGYRRYTQISQVNYKTYYRTPNNNYRGRYSLPRYRRY